MNTSNNGKLTPEVKARLKELGNQQGPNPIMVVKFCNPRGKAQWFISDYVAKDDTYIAYYMDAKPSRDDWKFITEKELESLHLKQDIFFTERHFADLERRA